MRTARCSGNGETAGRPNPRLDAIVLHLLGWYAGVEPVDGPTPVPQAPAE